MKTNSNKITCVLFILFLIFAFPGNDAYGQIKNRWNVKAGYTSYVAPQGVHKEQFPSFRAEVNYGVTDFLEIGPYVGFFNFKFGNSHISPAYGININLHILPFISKDGNLRLDAYLAGRYGGVYITDPIIDSHSSEYGLGVGVAYYIWRNIGIYGEYSLGKYHITGVGYDKIQRTSLRTGLTFKF